MHNVRISLNQYFFDRVIFLPGPGCVVVAVHYVPVMTASDRGAMIEPVPGKKLMLMVLLSCLSTPATRQSVPAQL